MDELEISGKIYISSKRAAKENKYHADYIGQLVRSGKILGTKVGRAWYVEAESLAEYLGKESEPIVVKKPTHAQQLEQAKEKEIVAKKELPVSGFAAGSTFSPRRIGLTYLSSQENSSTVSKQEFSDGSRVHIRTQSVPEPVQQSPSVVDVPLPRKSALKFLARMGRILFVCALVAVFVSFFEGSYLISYNSSVVNGDEVQTVSVSG